MARNASGPEEVCRIGICAALPIKTVRAHSPYRQIKDLGEYTLLPLYPEHPSHSHLVLLCPTVHLMCSWSCAFELKVKSHSKHVRCRIPFFIEFFSF